MLSINTQNEFLHDLYLHTGIQDVYFHKDLLWIENQLDIQPIERYLESSEWGGLIWYQSVESDEKTQAN